MENSSNNSLYLSVVVPVYNEQDNIAYLYNKIFSVCERIGRPYEIIFINDGSTDNTLNELKKLSPIKIINFRKNFGQTAAMDAGFKEARGFYIAPMDGDGQMDPNDIPRMIEKLEEENLDVISGWRKRRHDKILKRLSSRSAFLLRRLLINDGIHDSGCTLKIYKKECFEHIDLAGEMHRFIPAILKIKGYKIGEIEVNHFPRNAGKTKYSWSRGIKGVLDMVSVWFWKKYANRPLHLFGSIGIILIIVSLLAGLLAIYQRIFLGQDLSDTALTILSMFGFFIGIVFFVFGLISDMLSKNYYASTKDTIYDIKEIIENSTIDIITDSSLLEINKTEIKQQ